MSSNICTSNARADQLDKSDGAKKTHFKTVDANEVAARVAYRLNEVMAIYPITPSSPMAGWWDQWSSEGKLNLWETIPARTSTWPPLK